MVRQGHGRKNKTPERATMDRKMDRTGIRFMYDTLATHTNEPKQPERHVNGESKEMGSIFCKIFNISY